jgi:hypothetical protein
MVDAASNEERSPERREARVALPWSTLLRPDVGDPPGRSERPGMVDAASNEERSPERREAQFEAPYDAMVELVVRGDVVAALVVGEDHHTALPLVSTATNPRAPPDRSSSRRKATTI